MFQRVLLTLKMASVSCSGINTVSLSVRTFFFCNKKRNKNVFQKKYFEIALSSFFLRYFFRLLQDLILHMTTFIFLR